MLYTSLARLEKRKDMSMNTPIQMAKDRYGNELEELIRHYSAEGVVYSDNRLFVMAIMHNKELLEGKNSEKELDKLDCWYVHYAAGDIKRVYGFCPDQLSSVDALILKFIVLHKRSIFTCIWALPRSIRVHGKLIKTGRKLIRVVQF